MEFIRMNNTLQNGFKVLEYLAGSAEECTVKEIAEHFQMPNSHACRLLKTLAETGYVQQIPGRRTYQISLKILCLSNARLAKLSLRNHSRRYLQNLMQELKRPVYLSAPNEGFSVVVGTEYPEHAPFDMGLAIGTRHSINRSACGKICTAYLVPPEKIDAFLDYGNWSAATPNSCTDRERFKEELEQIRIQGYAVMKGEQHPGVGAVGAPIFNAEKAFAGAVGVILPQGEEHWKPELMEKFIARTRECAASISFAIGYPLK